MEPSELMQVALRFNEKINAQDLEGLAELMTDDHTFIDSGGNTTKGKNVMKEGWKDFFKKYPDYKNKFTTITVLNNVVVMIGYSTCSFKPLDGPNIWTARIKDERVSQWRVFWLNKR